MIRFIGLFIAIMSFIMLNPYQIGEAQAATYYVDGRSNCQVGCGSYTNPFKTVEKAKRKAKQGDKIIVKSKSQSDYTGFSRSNENVRELSFKVRNNR